MIWDPYGDTEEFGARDKLVARAMMSPNGLLPGSESAIGSQRRTSSGGTNADDLAEAIGAGGQINPIGGVYKPQNDDDMIKTRIRYGLDPNGIRPPQGITGAQAGQLNDEIESRNRRVANTLVPASLQLDPMDGLAAIDRYHPDRLRQEFGGF